VALQLTLHGTDARSIDSQAVFERRPLDGTSWLDVARGWLHGADTLACELVSRVPWRQGRRRMWDRMVDDPRLSYRSLGGGAPVHPAFTALGAALADHYGRPLRGPALNYYRDGRDSVAPHADRELRDLGDTLIAIVTLGARRPFLVRPKSGGRSLDLAPGSGDLLVMGGATQLGFTHAVPKVAHAGPRISLSWRWHR